MKNINKQSGFSPLLIIAIVAVIGIFGYLGYSYYVNSSDSSEVVEQDSTANDVQSAPETIQSVSELDDASNLLDEMDLENTDDNAQLDKELSTF